MTTPTNLKVDDLDFESIKENLKNFLKQQDPFLDVNFDASGINTLLDVLAYNTYYNATYLNFSATENFLSTAQKRNSVVNLARSLNYTPRSKTSAKIIGNIIATVTGNPTVVNFPKYTKFESIVDGTNFTFLTADAVTLFNINNNTYQADDVELIEGRFVSERYVFDSNNPDQRFLINNSNIDTSTLVVRVQNSSVDTTTRFFIKPDNVVEVTGTTLTYFIEEVEDGKFEIFFGDDVVGKALSSDNVIYFDYIVSEGLNGNGIVNLSFSSTVSGVVNAVFNADNPSFGGDERESVSRIKFNAPKSYIAQNRTVTAEDYLSLILKQPNVGSASVWGGEDNDPPQYGRVFIAIKPVVGNSLTQLEKRNIINTVIKPKKILTVATEIVDPEFILVNINANVKYDPRLTIQTRESIISSILNTILNYGQNEINQFSKYFRYSTLVRLIDQTEQSILNSAISTSLTIEVSLQLGVSTRYEINFSNPIRNVTIGRPSTFQFGVASQLSSNPFTFNGFNNCFLEENNGIIRIFRISRTEIIGVAQNVGTIDYDTGKIILTDFNPTAIDGGGIILRLTVIPRDLDLLPLRGQILRIDSENIKVNLADDTLISLVRR